MAFKQDTIHGYVDGPEIVRYFNELAGHLGNAWKELGRQLGLDEASIERIEADHTRTKDRTYYMLIIWRRQFGKSLGAALTELGGALEAIGNKLLAESCEEKVKEWQNGEKFRVPNSVEESVSETIEETVPLRDKHKFGEKKPNHVTRVDTMGCIKEMDNGLREMLKICQDGIHNSDKGSLFQRMRFLEEVQNFENIQHQMINNYKPCVTTIRSMEWVTEMEKNYRIRFEQENQTEKLIHRRLFGADRPKSDIPKRCSSPVDFSKLGPRSNTEGSSSNLAINRRHCKYCLRSNHDTVDLPTFTATEGHQHDDERTQERFGTDNNGYTNEEEADS